MKSLKLTMLAFLCIFSNLTYASINLYTAVSPTTGDSVSVWEDYTALGFNIFSNIQILGTWGTATTIGDPATYPTKAFAAINPTDQIVAIWSGVDPITGSQALYGSFNISGVWTASTLLSDPLSEFLLNDYNVKIGDDGQTIITWLSYSLSTGVNTVRAMYCPLFGTFTTPITIS